MPKNKTITTNLRLPSSLHKKLVRRAGQSNRSLNGQIVHMLTCSVGLAEGLEELFPEGDLRRDLLEEHVPPRRTRPIKILPDKLHNRNRCKVPGCKGNKNKIVLSRRFTRPGGR